MIINIIVGVLFAVLTAVFGLVPAYTLPAGVTGAGATLGAPLAALNGVFPVTTLAECVAVVLAARAFLFAWRVIVFIYDRLPFKAT